MKKNPILISSMLIFFFIVVHVNLISATVPTIIPNYGHIKTFGILYATPTDQEAQWMAQHLDLVIGTYSPIFKQYNPDMIVLKYVAGMSTLITPDVFSVIWNQCRASYNQAICEDMFFHLRKDANITTQSDRVTVLVKGWNPADDAGQCGGTANDGINDVINSCGQSPSDAQATAQFKNESRIPSWTINQRWINFNNTFWKSYYTDQVTQSFATGTSDEYNGLMNDEVGSSQPMPGVFLELSQSNPDKDYQQKTRDFITMLCSKTRAKGKLCSINGPYDTYADLVDFDTNEFWFTYSQELAWYQMNSTRGWTKPFNANNYYQMKQPQRSTALGTGELIQFMGIRSASWAEGCPGSGESFDRDKYYFLSLFYQVKNENSFYAYFPDNGAIYNVVLSTLWLPAIEIDIGQPVGNFGVRSGINYNYYNNEYDLFERNYTKGKILTFPRVNWNSCINPYTNVTFDLGGTYHLINYDGSVGPSITSIALPYKSGAILLKDAYAPQNAPHIDLIECNINNAWNACTNAKYGDSISSIRAICNDNAGVRGVSISMQNLDDQKNFFSNPATLSSGYWSVNNLNLNVQDSGDMRVAVNCTDIDDATVTNLSSWRIPFGVLSYTQDMPTTDGAVNQNSPFSFTTTAKCDGGECGNIKTTLDPTATFDRGTGLDDIYIEGAPSDNTNYQTGWQNGYMYFGRNPARSLNDYSTSRPLIRFNNMIGSGASKIPQRAVILDAELHVYQGLDKNYYTWPDITLNIYGVYKNWTETGVTFQKYDGTNGWSTAGAENAADRDMTPDSTLTIKSTDPNMWYTFNVTRTLQRIVNGDTANNGWIITADNGGSSTLYFLSKEWPNNPQNFPYLVVQYEEYGYKGIVPMNSGNPFYTTSQNPISSNQLTCLQNMKSGSSCTTSWIVVPTGNMGTEWNFYVMYASENYNAVTPLKTDSVYLTIGNNPNCAGAFDSNCNGCVSTGEIAQGVSDWKTGKISIATLIQGIKNWKTKGC
jgi:hypothetical protein